MDLHGIFWVLSPPSPHFMVSLLKFSYQTLLYLIKPAVELPRTTVDMLLFLGVVHFYYAFQATHFSKIFQWGRWFSMEIIGKLIIGKYLHQCLPILMVVPEHIDPQVTVLASFCCFWQDLSFLFSSRNTLVQFVVNCSLSF